MKKTQKVHDFKYPKNVVTGGCVSVSSKDDNHLWGLGKTEEPNVFIQDNRRKGLPSDAEPMYYKVDYMSYDKKYEPKTDFVVVYSINGVNLTKLKEQIVKSKQKDQLKSMDQFDIFEVSPISEEYKEELMADYHS